MDNKALQLIFPDARRPALIERQNYYGTDIPDIPTYFNPPIYSNPIGIEVEIEKWYGEGVWDGRCWRLDEDGSLKDHGVELISYPLYGVYIDLALHELNGFFLVNPKLTFSHRCSIHVHVNVSTFTRAQLFSLIALYALYEKSLFNFVDPERRGNSFCYPLTNTNPTFDWDYQSKYCAFNWKPITSQLTVEFRHLEGTKDLRKLRRWIALVTKLTNHALSLHPTEGQEIKKIISEGSGVEYARTVFGNTVVLLENLQESVDEGSMWAMSFLLNTIKEN